MAHEAAAAAERHARESYGRLLSLLAARLGDLAAAEDALADAFQAALTTWPVRGVPDNPAAWLFTAARNRHHDHLRSAAERVRIEISPEQWDDLAAGDAVPGWAMDDDALPDRRLALMLVCAHPAIAEDVHAPLMLQAVLGLQSDTIARAFGVPASALAQRLVRAKRKIKEAGIRFAVPGREALQGRLAALMEAVYAAFAVGWDLAGDALVAADDDLAEEARFLGTLLARLVPDDPEVLGLAALMALATSRRATRLDAAARYAPLSEQDASRWDRVLIAQGEAWLLAAHRLKRVGRFQLEAAIQSAHVDRARSGSTDWPAIAQLYEGLVRTAPSLGAWVGRALAVAHTQGAAQGLAALGDADGIGAATFQPYWAARCELLARSTRYKEAAASASKAASLAHSESARTWLLARAGALFDTRSGGV